QTEGHRLDAGNVLRDDARDLAHRVRLLPDPHAELQLRGEHERPAMAVLADSALGAGGPSNRGQAFEKHRWAVELRGAVGVGVECGERVLPRVEPVAEPVDLAVPRIQGLAAVLR